MRSEREGANGRPRSAWLRGGVAAGLLAGLSMGAGCTTIRASSYGRLYLADELAPAERGQLGVLEPQSGRWSSVVVDEQGAPRDVIEQQAQGAKDDFNVALLTGVEIADGELAVDFRAIDGEIDQGGGLVWRARDGRNYFLARWNPLEKNLRAYVVIDGKREQFASEKVELADGWHRMAVRFAGERVQVALDGKWCLDATRAPGELASGRVGLWTKADARTQFDELRWQDG
ncbi:MAG: hypothetical protein JNL90_05150 [Planctomycetes bacterium]|nr:hypothetical protein [Planctomycetota bacterium]